MFQVTGAFAEFERSMIRQRVHAGLKRAVAQGKQLGRPRIEASTEKRIQAQLRTGRRQRHRSARQAGDERPFRRHSRARLTARK
jgi:DNA invertase Pin-like site-specific DNA recombinase